MRRRHDPVVIPDPAARSGGHSAGNSQILRTTKVQTDFEAPELWRKHARQPWRVIFPDLDWEPPETD